MFEFCEQVDRPGEELNKYWTEFSKFDKQAPSRPSFFFMTNTYGRNLANIEKLLIEENFLYQFSPQETFFFLNFCLNMSPRHGHGSRGPEPLI